MNILYKDIVHIKTKNKNKKGTIMFIHGFTSSNMLHYYFQKNFPENSEYDYLAINLLGHKLENKNSTNNKDYNFFNYVEYLERYIIENDLNNLIIIGHSMGGGIALFLTERIKSRIKKIILVSAINSSIFMSKVGIEFINCMNNNSLNGIKNIEFFKNQVEINNDDDSNADDTIKKYIFYEIDRFLKNKKKYIYLGAQLIDPGLYIKLDKIYKKNKIPTLFLIGKFDKVIPYTYTIKYLKQLKNSHLTIKTIANASHVCFVDNFKEYNDYVWWFINL